MAEGEESKKSNSFRILKKPNLSELPILSGFGEVIHNFSWDYFKKSYVPTDETYLPWDYTTQLSGDLLSWFGLAVVTGTGILGASGIQDSLALSLTQLITGAVLTGVGRMILATKKRADQMYNRFVNVKEGVEYLENGIISLEMSFNTYMLNNNEQLANLYAAIKELIPLTERIPELEQVIGSLELRVENGLDSLEKALLSQHNTFMQSFEKAINELENKIKGLDENMKSLSDYVRAKYQGLSDRVDGYNISLNDVGNELSGVAERLPELEKAISDHKSSLVDLQKRFDEYSEQLIFVVDKVRKMKVPQDQHKKQDNKPLL